MSIDQALKWGFVGLIAALDLVLLNFCNIELQWSDLRVPLVGGLLLAALSVHYYRRGGDALVLCMVTLMHIGCYTTVISVLIYEVTSFGFPLIDAPLRAFDSVVGYSPSAFVHWTRSHPVVDHWSTWVYLFIIPETMLMVLVVAFSNHRVVLEQFVWQFMLGSFICAGFACFMPANGPLHNHGIVPTDWQQPFLDHFAKLRSGDKFLFSWQGTEGLVTFPSFHTAWALMLILVWRKQTKWLSIPMAILNGLIILSTLSTGEHYIFDLIGGVGVTVVCVFVSLRVTAFAYEPNGAPREVSWLSRQVYRLPKNI
jgi:membrane-associated phospholipid phosphatase